ncbi:uncharacterized protein [Leptinotarsa decemlineata]|uniref:uncharacterized protein n=1 Tax=Leptinotarsa decemlineata TaxID=7539 RepID=UPI003D307EDD
MMKRSHENYLTILLTVLVLIDSTVYSEVLFECGWYKSHKKGHRNPLTNVSFIDSSVVTDRKYLKIKAKIPTIFANSFRKLEHVETLKLTSCGIFNIEPGAFTNLSKLVTLSFYENKIVNIKTGVFNNLLVTKLYLHRNQIEVIETHAFDDMPNLQTLKMNSNFISSWDSNWFRNTPQLRDLFFRRNQLEHIPSEAFQNINGERNNGTQSGTKIYLSKNFISSIDSDAFSGLRELSQLWLDRNELAELDEKLFSNMDYMDVINVSKNKLRNLPGNLLSSLKTDLLILDLSQNHNISCLDYNIFTKVKMTKLERISKLDCNCVKICVGRISKSGEDNEISSDCELVMRK